MSTFDDDKFHDECAVVGVWGHAEAAKLCYLGLYSLQHRGQEGAGIVSWDGAHHRSFKNMGLVADVFSGSELSQLPGDAAIGHTRYATCGSKDRQNLQPLIANFLDSSIAISHNGNLVNAEPLRRSLESQGAIFSSTSDTEVILHLLARTNPDLSFALRIADALRAVQGAYSLTILADGKLFAVRDPAGVRPLSIGKIDGGYVFASETVALDLLGATFLRDVEPGEIVEVHSDGALRSNWIAQGEPSQLCIFEFVYFARPDSVLQSRGVYQTRKNLGVELAREQPSEVDLVIPVPDSGVPAAIGYAQELGVPFEMALIRNHYVGRTFIEPQQAIRNFGVKVKLNPAADMLRGKRVAVIDDSIVRGTTSQKILRMLRAAGAREVHFRISSPPTVAPCYYGIDTPTRSELIANQMTTDEICRFVGADSLGYLSVEGMYRALGSPCGSNCDACFTGNYRLGIMPRSPLEDARRSTIVQFPARKANVA